MKMDMDSRNHVVVCVPCGSIHESETGGSPPRDYSASAHQHGCKHVEGELLPDLDWDGPLLGCGINSVATECWLESGHLCTM